MYEGPQDPVHRDAGQVRGRPHRQGLGRPAHRGGEDLRAAGRQARGVRGRRMHDRHEFRATTTPSGRRQRRGHPRPANISLRFGGVKALTDISFDVREHEVRAIIGPNGAGKSSMLNVINGVYHPQEGTITFRGEQRRDMEPHDGAPAGHRAHLPEHRAVQGHERARQHHDRAQPQDEVRTSSSRRCGSARRARGDREPREGRGDHRLPRDPAHPQDAGRARCPTACRSASSSAARWPPSRRCCCSTSRWPA
jgi:hypothetical protein